MISASGNSAVQLLFGSNKVDPSGWDDPDENLLFSQDTSVSGQFARQWELRMMAQGAALIVTFWRKRRLTAPTLRLGTRISLTRRPRGTRISLTKRTGLACILDIDGTGATARYQSQTFVVARRFGRKPVGAKEMRDTEGPPGLGTNGYQHRTSALEPASAS